MKKRVFHCSDMNSAHTHDDVSSAVKCRAVEVGLKKPSFWFCFVFKNLKPQKSKFRFLKVFLTYCVTNLMKMIF